MTHQQLMNSRACNGACETEAGCNCWSGVQVVRHKLSESDLDARQAERDADTLRRRQAYMAAEAATELGTDDPEPLEWRDMAWMAGVMCAGGLLLATVAYAVFGG